MSNNTNKSINKNSSEKEFKAWHFEKTKLEKSKIKQKCHRRQIWLAKIGENIGNETSKNNPFLRPILILNNYFGGDLVLVLPITSSQNKKLSCFYFLINGQKYGLKHDSYIMINQVKVISKKRLARKLNTCERNGKYVPKLDIKVFNNIIQSFKQIIHNKNQPSS